MRDIAVALTAKTVFPDLQPDQIKVAKIAIDTLKSLYPSAGLRTQQPPVSAAMPTGPATPKVDIAKHKSALDALLPSIGTAPGGRAFEGWFVSLANDCGMKARARYSTQTRELDGSIEVDHAVYLLELKFTSDKSDAPAVGDFLSKVGGHAAGTVGLFVGMMGFTKNAVDVASRAGSPVFLMDGVHIYRVLHGSIGLSDLI
ncbi:MAG TPA: restriction endonuclease, partial [Phycisphaerales bacterium]|nr:restriction endonuclease [Phycisphaerales bacterium]